MPELQQHRCRVQSSRQLQNNSPAEAQKTRRFSAGGISGLWTYRSTEPIRQHHIFNWGRLWTKTGFNEWEAEPPVSVLFNEGFLCEPREIDTQWEHLSLVCWAETQQVEKAVKTSSYQHCNYISFQVFLEAGTWVSHREAHLTFTYSCNCYPLFFFLQINTSFHTSLHSQRNSWYTKHWEALISSGGVGNPLDVIPQLPPALIRPGGGFGRRQRGEEMLRKEPEVTLLLRNIILPVKHSSLLKEAMSPAWLARRQQASGTAWFGMISLKRLSLKSSGLFTPQQSNWWRERRREKPFAITKCPFVHYPLRCIHTPSINIDLNFAFQLLTWSPQAALFPLTDAEAKKKTAGRSSFPSYCSHDGVPRGGKDVSVVVALIMSFQLLGKVLSGQLKSNGTSQPHHKRYSQKD